MVTTVSISANKITSVADTPPVDARIVTTVINVALTNATIRRLRGFLPSKRKPSSTKYDTQNAIKNNSTAGTINKPTGTV